MIVVLATELSITQLQWEHHIYRGVRALLRWADIYNLIWEMYDAVECIRFIIVSISGKLIHNSTVQSVTLFEGNSGMCIVYSHI